MIVNIKFFEKNSIKLIFAITLSLFVSLLAFNYSAFTKNNDIGSKTEPFFDVHQAGIETEQQAQVTLLAFDINPETDLAAIGRLMRLWSSDAAKATQGQEVIGDPNPGMEKYPARLTATFGFGYSLFIKLGITDRWPILENKLPKFSIDKLENRWSDGDLLVQIAGDDPISIFHLSHLLKRDAAPFAKVRYQQRGFLNSAGVGTNEIGRNLLGQIDGTASPTPGSEEFKKAAWITEGENQNGSIMVVRRIRFALEQWDRLSLNKKSQATGRTIEMGETLTSVNSHVSVAKDNSSAILVRRGFNYDDGYLSDGSRDAGLIFIAYQKDLKNFIGIQTALAKVDSLNKWTTPIGSSLFLIPPGITSISNDWIGKKLLAMR